jgi:uncharacterized phage-like protein YoqJ
MSGKICCFTGHRTIPTQNVGALVRILDAHLERLADEGYTEFRTGGARGFDTLAALRVVSLCHRHPDCHLSLILPCRDQTKLWRTDERAVFEDILSRASQVRYIADTYTPTCMYERNRALVNGSDLCIAYLTRNTGGTLYTCAYALKNGVALLNLSDEL